jgi:hypothetical protein
VRAIGRGAPAPSSWNATRRIVWVSCVVWVRQMAARLRLSPRSVVAAVAGAASTVAALGVGAGFLAVGGGGADLSSDPGELRVLFAAACLAGFLSTIGLSALMPRNAALDSTLELLPVSRAATTVGQRLTVCLCSWLIGVTMSGSALAVLWQAQRSTVTVVGTLLLLGTVAGSVVAAAGLLHACEWLLRVKVSLPLPYAVSGSSVAVATVAVLLLLQDLPFPAWRLPLPHTAARAAAEVVAGPTPVWSALVLASWALAAAAMFVGASRLRAGDAADGYAPLLTGLSFPSRRFPSLVWTEGLQLVRSPQFLVLSLATLLAVLIAAALQGRVPLLGSVAGSSLLLAPYFFGLQSFGRTAPHHWIGDVVAAAPSFWVAPKALACLLAGSVIAVPAALVFIQTGITDVGGALALIPSAALAWSATMLAGLLAPYNEQDSASSTLTAFAVLTVYSAASGLAYLLTRHTPIGDAAAQAGLAAVLGTLYLLVGTRGRAAETRA